MAASQTLRTLKLSLLADVSQFGRELDKAGNGFQQFSRRVDQASRFADVAIAAIGGIAISSVNAASDLEETGAAVEQVFGARASRQLQAFARDAAQALGQSRQQALSAAQTFGIFGTSAGLADDDLVEFTTSLVTLAADLASFNNTDVDTAITALGAALRGESEPIRQYGVLLDAATLQQRALAEGIIETTETALTPQQRTLAAYAEILAQTELQQGDFARTSEGLANSQRVLKAELENFRVELGEQLLPVVQELLPEIRGLVDTFTSADPEKIVQVGVAIAGLAVSIRALKAALSAYALVAANPVLAGLLAVAGLSARGAFSESAQADIDRRIAEGDTRFGVSDYTNVRPPAPAPTPIPRGGRGTGGQGPIIINGVVGSSYQVFREIERATAAGTRAGIGTPSFR